MICARTSAICPSSEPAIARSLSSAADTCCDVTPPPDAPDVAGAELKAPDDVRRCEVELAPAVGGLGEVKGRMASAIDDRHDEEFLDSVSAALTDRCVDLCVQQGSRRPQTPPPLLLPPGKLLSSRASARLQLVLLRTVYSQAQGCVCTAIQLGGDVEQPRLTSKYDVIHKTGST